MVSKEQIERFFNKQCTAKEAAQVAAWLKANPEIMNRYLQEHEWQEASSDKENLPKESYNKVWSYLHQRIRRQKIITLLKQTAVAACIGSCLVISFLYTTKEKTIQSPLATHIVLKARAAVSDTEYNYAAQPRRILLQDSSVITLQPNAVVWFDTPFVKLNRDIYLQGEARFEVAKNKQRPFTVYAASFSTTALGTEFIVKQQRHNVKVQLLHGRVVIKSTDNTVKNWKNIYLSPGEQMVYDEANTIAKVSLIQAHNRMPGNKAIAENNEQRETPDSLIFNGSPMAIVLQKLHDYYGVNIQFVDEDIKNISFTGVIVKKDSVQTILKVITQMNNLSVESTDSSFTISKEKN